MLHQLVLISDVFSDVGLVETHDGHGVRVTAVCRRFGGHPESQRKVTHRVHDDSLVFVRVSVILPSPDLTTLCPYRNCCAADAFSQILWCAYGAR